MIHDQDLRVPSILVPAVGATYIANGFQVSEYNLNGNSPALSLLVEVLTTMKSCYDRNGMNILPMQPSHALEGKAAVFHSSSLLQKHMLS